MSPVNARPPDRPFPHRLRLTVGFVAGVILPLLCAADARRAGLPIEERVAAQQAIEQVYWNHRTWPKENPARKPSLAAVLSNTAIRERVEDALRKSNALEKYWHHPLTAEQLQAELNRMAAHTHDEALLRELFAALGNDPHLVAETLARQALVDRLARNWYSNDDRFHGELRKKAKAALARCQRVECMPSIGGEYHETTWKLEAPEEGRAAVGRSKGDAHRDVIRMDESDWKGQLQRLAERFRGRPESLPLLKLSGMEETEEALIVTAVLSQARDEIRTATVTWPKSSFDEWWPTVRDTLTPQVEDTPSQFTLPAVGSSGCVADTWAATSPGGPGQPSGRMNHSAVWTGTEMIVWGGNNGSNLNTGARYEPATDTWAPTSTGANVPSGRQDHTAVWTGIEMIVWGGSGSAGSLNTGGRYDPSTDSWTSTSTGANVPVPRNNHTAVWTGTEMIVWGGGGSTYMNTGGRYDPSTDSWTTTSMGANLPVPRTNHTAVWTGTEMIVWGGLNGSIGYLSSGARYDPSTDTWTPTSTGANVPAARQIHTAVWTGTEMIVWGGANNFQIMNTGGRYDPSVDTWTPTSTGANVPAARQIHSAVWTGTEMIVWGGYNNNPGYATGAGYNPSLNTWTPISTGANVPAGRYNHTGVWTGTEMIIWGGYNGSLAYLDTGGRYDPSTNTWIPTLTKSNGPSARIGHTAVWTGTEMVVWGGYGNSGYLNTGGRYDPAIDTWSTTQTGPLARYVHQAVWTGTVMIVWGGYGFGFLNSGGVYSPSANTWTLTSSTNAPTGRDGHTIVWTGYEMIVWGGIFGGGYLNTGGRYNPVFDTWTPTSTAANVPAERYIHSAIWTGTEMIVWGGYNGITYMNTGGRYDPSTDTWTPTSTGADVPVERYSHTAIWTDSEMVIWGGYNASTYMNTGGRYDPSTDTWTPTSTGADVPAARYGHTAIWSGTEMIVWGGNNSAHLNTGGRYDPIADTWIPTSTDANVAASRSGHTAIWAVKQMIVWGGLSSTQYENTGALYCVCPNGAIHYLDEDGDGYGGPYRVGQSCDGALPPGTSAIPGDCNDANAAVHPGAPESCNALDDDCDGAIDESFDVDRDGFTVCTGDCDDRNPTVYPGAVELCDGLDNDCNGAVDGFATSCGVGQCFRTGACVAGVNSCVPGSPTVEVCDDLDNDCDGLIDEGFDADQDGFKACAGDCDDGHATVHPGAAEICDNLDNDCNGTVDGFDTSCGFGPCFRTGSCTAGLDSCAPGTPSLEICDGIDNNCDGYVDDVPIPAGPLSLTLSSTGGAPSLGWTSLADATGYDVVEGDLLTLLTGRTFTSAILACLANDSEGNALPVGDPPALGTGFFYVVRGVTCSGPGSYDEGQLGQLGSRDYSINASPLSCPQASFCGDAVCSLAEDCSTCAFDCGPCVVCGDYYCDPYYEDCYTCPFDCGDCCIWCWPD